MAVATLDFTTGPSTLPDIGELSYNGCVFSPLFESNVSGVVIRDNASRTTKYMEYTITVDGYVTLPAGATTTTGVMATLRNRLSAQGGRLVYRGRGCDINVNGAVLKDVAWGPTPEVLEFQPLGAGRSAKVKWTVKTRIPEIVRNVAFVKLGEESATLLQFNYETVVSYGDDGFSTLSIRGTQEIPLTRTPMQNIRTVPTTVDSLRIEVENRLLRDIDLSRFRVTRREFSVSRDKRTMEWDFALEEKPYMDLPPDCTIARGSYNVRPARAGMGLCKWLCTLRATYTVRADRPRRVAWLAFLALLRLRMRESSLAIVPLLNEERQNPLTRAFVGGFLRGPVVNLARGVFSLNRFSSRLWGALIDPPQVERRIVGGNEPGAPGNAWLIDFSFDEGLYLDSKTTSFSATWRIVTVFSHILLASGLWKKVPEKTADGSNLWATTMRNVSVSQSWLQNTLNPNIDIIVDFGGG